MFSRHPHLVEAAGRPGVSRGVKDCEGEENIRMKIEGVGRAGVFQEVKECEGEENRKVKAGG